MRFLQDTDETFCVFVPSSSVFGTSTLPKNWVGCVLCNSCVMHISLTNQDKAGMNKARSLCLSPSTARQSAALSPQFHYSFIQHVNCFWCYTAIPFSPAGMSPNKPNWFWPELLKMSQGLESAPCPAHSKEHGILECFVMEGGGERRDGRNGNS